IAVVDHPATLEPEHRIDLAAARPVIAVAELVRPDELAIGPGPQLGPERRGMPPGEDAQQKRLDHGRLVPPGRVRVQTSTASAPTRYAARSFCDRQSATSRSSPRSLPSSARFSA